MPFVSARSVPRTTFWACQHADAKSPEFGRRAGPYPPESDKKDGAPFFWASGTDVERRHPDKSRQVLVLGENLAVGEAGALAGAGEAGVVVAGHGLERVRMNEGVEGGLGLELVDDHVLPGLGAHVVGVERNSLVAAHGEAAGHA